MNDMLYRYVHLYLDWFQNWSNPWYWISISLVLFLLGLLGTHPIIINKTKDPTLLEMGAVKLRQLSLVSSLVLALIIPLSVWGAGVKLVGPHFTEPFIAFIKEGFMNIWEFPILGFIFGKLISFTYHRYVSVSLSAFKRKISMRQTGEELSDIRAEEGKLIPKKYNPQDYYKEGFVFFGLDDKSKPIYVTREEWKSRHMRLVGPTQTGKGVEIGLQLDQSIRAGDTVFFIDPKPDLHARAIMKKAAEETGRSFIECDLNDEGKGKYNPFMGGAKRDRRSRLMYVLGLNDSGESGADFYKSAERALIDNLMDDWDGSLLTLRELLTSNDYLKDNTKRAQNYINEWLSISTFKTSKGRKGLDIERSMLENAVVYIRGNLDDEVINVACSCLLMELTSEAKRLHGKRNSHIFGSIDEVAFLITEKFADALATVAGFDMNLSLAYQSEGDLLNLKDKTQNAKAINSRVTINSKYSLYYMAQDAETAEVMAENSGLIQKSVTRSEKVSVGNHLEEEWLGERDIHRVEANLITSNMARMLPERVGVFYQPAKIATFCFTSWINIDLEKWGGETETREPNQKPAIKKDSKEIKVDKKLKEKTISKKVSDSKISLSDNNGTHSESDSKNEVIREIDDSWIDEIDDNSISESNESISNNKPSKINDF